MVILSHRVWPGKQKKVLCDEKAEEMQKESTEGTEPVLVLLYSQGLEVSRQLHFSLVC